MLYVPYYTLFVQENISKDQKINQNAKSARLSEQVPKSTKSARLQLAYCSLKRAQQDKATWQLLNGQRNIFQPFA